MVIKYECRESFCHNMVHIDMNAASIGYGEINNALLFTGNILLEMSLLYYC